MDNGKPIVFISDLDDFLFGECYGEFLLNLVQKNTVEVEFVGGSDDKH